MRAQAGVIEFGSGLSEIGWTRSKLISPSSGSIDTGRADENLPERVPDESGWVEIARGVSSKVNEGLSRLRTFR